MKVPARKICFSFTRCAPFFFVSFLLLQNTHIKRVVARSHHEVCVSSKARRSCSISPRGVFRVVERAFKKRLRERERERTFFAGRRVFSNSTKKYSGKARERKPIMVSKETALHDPDELLFYLRGEDDTEIVAESAKGQSEPKRTSMTAKQRLKQQLHLQKQKERQRKTNEEMVLGKQSNATREKSSEQSRRLVRMRRNMQNGQRLNQSLQPVAKGLAVTAGSGSVRTKEVLQALHTATDKLERHHKLLQLALMREARLEEKLKAEKDKVKKLQVILNSNTTLLPQQSLPHTATLEQTNTIMVSTISSISNQAFEDGSNTLSTKRKIHLPTGSDESLQSPMKVPKQAHRDDVLENHGVQSQLPSTAQYFVRKSGSSTKPKCTLDVRAPPSSSLPRGLHSPVKPPRFEKLKDVLMRLPTIRHNEA